MAEQFLESVLIEILNMSLTAGIVILVVLAARILLKKAPLVFSYALWAVVLFRLLCPVSFTAPLSLLGTLRNESGTAGRMEYIPENIGYQMNPEVQLPLQSVNEDWNEAVNSVLPAGSPETSVNPLQVFLYIAARIWVLGIVVMLAYSAVSLMSLKKRLGAAVRESDRIYRFPGKGTPFVYGLFRPRIYLPDSLTLQEERYILLHEEIHIHRGDHIFRVLAWLALMLHWFNPLVWAAFHFSGKDMEMSCDEAVLKKLGNGVKKEYSASLLSLASGQHGPKGMPLAFGEGDTGSRIRSVLRYRRPKRLFAGTALVLCVLLAIWLLANPAPVSPDNQNVYYGVVTRVEIAGSNEQIAVRIPRLGDVALPEAETMETGLEREIEGIQEGDLLRIVFPAENEIALSETYPASFSGTAERIEIAGEGFAMSYEGADTYRFAVPLDLAAEAEPGDVLHIYYDANENAGQPGETVEEELLASAPVLEVDAEALDIWTELSTDQTELFLSKFGSGITCGLGKTGIAGEPQILSVEALEDNNLDGRWIVRTYSVSRSARCIDLYWLDGQAPEELEENSGLAFSEDCMFMVNREMDRRFYEETDFTSFAAAVMDGADGPGGPYKTLLCEFEEGQIIQATLLYAWEAYGIRSEGITADTFYRDMQEITGLDEQQLLDMYYTSVGMEQLDTGDGSGMITVQVYTGNIGDGDSGIVLLRDEEGAAFYSLSAHTARAGWNNIYLGELDGEAFILTLHIEDRDTYGRYDYMVLQPRQSGVDHIAGSSFEWGGSGTTYNDEYFHTWADNLSLYLESSYLLLSTQEGEIRTEHVSEADRYSYETLRPSDSALDM